MKPKPPVNVRNITPEAVADELNIHVKTVRSWCNRKKNPCPHDRAASGRIWLSAAEVARWMKDSQTTGRAGRPSTTSPELQAAQLRKENALADRYTIQVRRERAQLTNLADVKCWIKSQCEEIAAAFKGLGATLTPRLAGRDTGDQQTIIDAEVIARLTQLSDDGQVKKSAGSFPGRENPSGTPSV